MKCAWTELLCLLPPWMRSDVDQAGKEQMQELRLRLAYPPELVCQHTNVSLSRLVTREDIEFVINIASRYSPWQAQTFSQGYLTAAGGHRIGICGEAIIKEGRMAGIRNPKALCIRVARDLQRAISANEMHTGSVLVIGKPGSGKTTLLRDLIRSRSQSGNGSIGVVDERGELFPSDIGFDPGRHTDVLSGCSKDVGMEALLRTMGPHTIAVDEITSEADCEALLRAARCGVDLIATAHASGKQDLLERPVYRPLIRNGIFDTLIILQKDKSWVMERMTLCSSLPVH